MKLLKNLISQLLLIFLVVLSCKNDTKEKDTTDEKSDTYVNLETTSTCLSDSSWFQINPNTRKRHTPAPKEDSSSVFGNNTTVSNCDFHQWSWQKFLWLTNDDGGRPFFLNNLIQVNNQSVPVTGSETQVVLTSADNKQATGNILKTNKTFNATNTSYDVYYSIHLDSTLYNSIQKYAHMDPSDYKDATFPVGALELKVAWVDASAISDTSTYFVTNASLEGEAKQIALLGIHVVGVVYNHPEFVWATFEHDDMVPYYDWKATTTQDVPVTSSNNKLLFNVDTTANLANITPSSDSTNVFAVNQYGSPRQAKNTFLVTSQSEPENYNNISTINSDVKSKLSDIWNNYYYNGSIWINTEGYSYPTEQAKLLVGLGNSLYYPEKGKLPRGSVAAYNITMETYEQLGFSPTSIHGQNVKGMGNCFSCHSAGNGSALNISHAFNGATHRAKGLTPKETKKIHLNEIQDFIAKMK